MPDAIVVALVTGACSIVGAIITGIITSNKSVHQMEISRAVTDTKIEELTREVRSHNNFAQRMPVVEAEIGEIKRRIDEYHSH